MSKEKKELKIYWADSLIYPCIHLYGGILQFISLHIIWRRRKKKEEKKKKPVNTMRNKYRQGAYHHQTKTIQEAQGDFFSAVS